VIATTSTRPASRDSVGAHMGNEKFSHPALFQRSLIQPGSGRLTS
jgi:hypothetical protein